MIFLAALRREGIQQIRSGISALYIGVSLVWGGLLRLAPLEIRTVLTPLAIYADPALMGFILSGALLARERDQGLFRALAVTPVGAFRWLGARVLVVAVEGTAGGLLLAGLSGVSFRPGPLIAAVAVTSAVGVLLGSLAGRPFRDLGGYIIVGGLLSGLVNLPSVAWLGWLDGPWCWMSPALPGISAIGWAFGNSGPHIGGGAALAILTVWFVVGFAAVARIVDRGFFRRGRAR